VAPSGEAAPEDQPKPTQTTERKPGDVLTFGDYGMVTIHFVESGQVYFASAKRGDEDSPWLARMTFADFEASVMRTAERLENQDA
jgi:hypothetical protein